MFFLRAIKPKGEEITLDYGEEHARNFISGARLPVQRLPAPGRSKGILKARACKR